MRIGHVHLKVADLDRSLAFYRDALGFQLQGRIGDQAAFLAADGDYHHIGLNTFESAGGPPPAPGTTGLYHVALVYPTREALAHAGRRPCARQPPARRRRAAQRSEISAGSDGTMPLPSIASAYGGTYSPSRDTCTREPSTVTVRRDDGPKPSPASS